MVDKKEGEERERDREYSSTAESGKCGTGTMGTGTMGTKNLIVYLYITLAVSLH